MASVDESQTSLELGPIQPSTAPHPSNVLSIPTGSFANASDFVMNQCSFYDLSGMSGLDKLFVSVSTSAYHDGFTQNPRAKCHPGTRGTILETVSTWYIDSCTSPSHPVMWVHGPAGSGKSSIAQSIAETYAEVGKLAASFFFLRDDPDRGVIQRLVPTLAWRIAQTVPGIAAYIDSALRRDTSLATKSIDMQFEHLIVKPFRELASSSAAHPGNMLVIIDAIDECKDEQAQTQALQLIKDVATQTPLRFLICSRPEDHLRRSLWPDVARRIALEDNDEVRDDIRRYLEDEFSRIIVARKMETLPSESWPSDKVLKSLVSKSSAQFIYASTVIKFVDDEDYDPQKQLDVILGLCATDSSSPFAALDQLYTQILSQQRDYKFLLKVLALITVFRRPSLRYLSVELKVDMDDLIRKLRRIHSLLHVSWFVEAHHVTLFDYLRDKRRSGGYFISTAKITAITAMPFVGEFIRLLSELVNGRGIDRCTTALNISVKALDAHGFSLFLLVLSEVYIISWIRTFTLSGIEANTGRSFRRGGKSISSSVLRSESTYNRYAVRGSKLGPDILEVFVSPFAGHRSVARLRSNCHPGTGEASLGPIINWINDPNATEPIMWLYGPAGTGKSTIVQTIAEHCERDGKLAASFFFSRGSSSSGNIDHLIPTIASQLIRSIPETAPLIESALESDPSIPTMFIHDQFDRLIVETFETLEDSLSARPAKPLIIIDGLDECSGEELQNDLLQLIEGALRCRSLPLRFLISSRFETRIARHFDSMSNMTRRLGLSDNSEEARADIQRYLKDELFRISSERSPTSTAVSWPSDTEIEFLVRKSSGRFIYASTAVKFIDDNDHDPKGQLDAILQLPAAPHASPFAEMDQLYTHILSQQDYKTLMKVLVIVVALRQPRLDYIKNRLSIPEDKLRLRLRGMRPLLHFSESHLEPCHDSLPQFLQDRKRAGRFHVGGIRVIWARFFSRVHRLWVAICNAYRSIRPHLRYPKLTAFCLLIGVIGCVLWIMFMFWTCFKIACKIKGWIFPNSFMFVEGFCLAL